jgi:hypothetical protein
MLCGGDLLTPDERKEIDSLVAAMVAAGFPDGAKAKAYSGKLSVSATFEPPKEPSPLPPEASTTQMTGPGSKMTYGYAFDGLHLKLADGSWVISLLYRFKPRAGDSVDASGAPEVDLAGLTAAAAQAHPFQAEKQAAKYLESLDPAYRKRTAQAMDLVGPVTKLLKLNPDPLAPAIVLLHRAGWPDAAAASLALADHRARSYWLLRPWTDPNAAFDPTGAYPKAKDEEQAWKTAHPLLVPEPPGTALRRALFRWCRAQILADEALLSRDAAAAACKAALDPKDPQGNAARTDALLAGSNLPVTPPAGADLAARLQSWEAAPRKPRMSVTGGGGGGGNTLTMSTSFTAPPPAYAPKKEDLDALVAFLADERPSRFWDFSGPRTAGDNAWRAVATLLEADPRRLAGHPMDKPWTAAERRAAASAVQRWWKDHRRDYVGK